MSFTQTSSQSLASTIQNLATQAGLKVTVQNDDYVQCGLGLPNNRSQLVHIMSAGNFGNQNVAHIWTPVTQLPGAGLPGEIANGMLRENANFKIGAFGVREVQGSQLLVFFHNVVLESLDASELMTVIGVVGTTGDQWEQKLGGGDQF